MIYSLVLVLFVLWTAEHFYGDATADSGWNNWPAFICVIVMCCRHASLACDVVPRLLYYTVLYKRRSRENWRLSGHVAGHVVQVDNVAGRRRKRNPITRYTQGGRMTTLNKVFLWLRCKQTFMKLLKTSNTDIVKYSQDQFAFKLPSELIPNRTAKFTAKLQASDCV